MPSSTLDNLLPKYNGGPLEHAESDTNTLKKLEEPEPPSTTQLQKRCHELELALWTTQEVVKHLQQQDYNAHKKAPVESHEIVSRQFYDIFRLLTIWAREHFRISLDSFCLDEHELFKKHLDDVLWDDSGWITKKKMNVSHLVQAVVAEVLSKRILMSPFAGCADPFGFGSGQLYEAMLKEDKAQAHKWRATTLAAYERCEKWPPFSVSPEPISRYRENYYKEIANEIDSIVGPIAKKHFPEKQDHDERFQRSMVFIEAAGNLAVKLGKQAAELKIIDKPWFESSRRVFASDDERMKGRLAEEDEESEEDLRVDIILRPGFLKHGNSEGEDYEQYAVWIPAVLDLRKFDDSEVKVEGDIQSIPEIKAPEDDITMLDTLPVQPPLHPDYAQNVPFVRPPHDEPVGNELGHQQQQRDPEYSPHSPEGINPESLPVSRQSTMGINTIYQDEPPTGPVQVEGENSANESPRAPRKRTFGCLLGWIKERTSKWKKYILC